MNRYIVTDGRVVDRVLGNLFSRTCTEQEAVETAHLWNRAEIHAAARRRGVKP